MIHDLKKHLKDQSTPEAFCFALRCSECGRLIQSTPIRFSMSGIIPASTEKQIVLDAVYRREKESALCRAVSELKSLVSECPICLRTVCDRCFLICDELDMCVNCADRLHEQGDPVLA